MHTYPLGRSQTLAQHTGPFCERPGARLLYGGSAMRKAFDIQFSKTVTGNTSPARPEAMALFMAPNIRITTARMRVNQVLSQCCQSDSTFACFNQHEIENRANAFTAQGAKTQRSGSQPKAKLKPHHKGHKGKTEDTSSEQFREPELWAEPIPLSLRARTFPHSYASLRNAGP